MVYRLRMEGLGIEYLGMEFRCIPSEFRWTEIEHLVESTLYESVVAL